VSSAVIVGASSGVGRALAERLAGDGFDLVLVAREATDLEATASDLRLRFGKQCAFIVADIARVDFCATEFLNDCVGLLGQIDCLLVPAGGVWQDDIGANPDVIAGVLLANYLGPARLAAAFGRAMAERGSGSIVLFSSIAAAAPRRRNAAYSAAKAALETYAKALRHELEPKGVRVLVIALGYVDTAQSYGLELRFPVARPEAVAGFVTRAAKSRAGKHYYPWFWWWITTLLRFLPWRIYSRLSF
jgi:short-subunit dehydrogenase